MATLRQRHVLVLNKLWTAVNVVTLRKALRMIIAERALVIDPTAGAYATYTWQDWSKMRCADNEESILTALTRIKVPEIILLTDYDNLPGRKVKFSRRMIHKRDNFSCQYCGKQVPTTELTIDHIVPRCQGGLTTWTNCVTCCQTCNSRKAGFTLQHVNMKLQRTPKRPELNLFKIEKKFVYKSWKSFIDSMVSHAYWETELENDNTD